MKDGGTAASVGVRAFSASRGSIRASAGNLHTLCEHSLDQDEVVPRVVDGETFADDEIVIVGVYGVGADSAPGVPSEGTGIYVASGPCDRRR